MVETLPIGAAGHRRVVVKKSDLASKVCQHCGRPFAWRKKWERDWEQVRYCSERCKRDAKSARSARSG